ncbi:ELKS/Rab6-interacting/CAST family member 1 isoform X1 [Tachysurus ichikawai]
MDSTHTELTVFSQPHRLYSGNHHGRHGRCTRSSASAIGFFHLRCQRGRAACRCTFSQFLQEALLAAISEKDANIALLELSASKKKKTQDEVALLKREKDRLVQQLKQQIVLFFYVITRHFCHRSPSSSPGVEPVQNSHLNGTAMKYLIYKCTVFAPTHSEEAALIQSFTAKPDAAH